MDTPINITLLTLYNITWFGSLRYPRDKDENSARCSLGKSITILNMIEMLTISGLSSDISKRIFRPELGKGLKTATYRPSWIAKII